MPHATDPFVLPPTLSSICSSLLRLADQFGLLLTIHITECQSQTFFWSNGLADFQQSCMHSILRITLWSTKKEMGQATIFHLTESAAIAAFHQARNNLVLHENRWKIFQRFCEHEKQLPPPTTLETLGEFHDWHFLISKMGLEHKRFFQEKIPNTLQSKIKIQQEKHWLCRSDGSFYESQFWRATLQATSQVRPQAKFIQYQDGATFFEQWHPTMNALITNLYAQLANRLSISQINHRDQQKRVGPSQLNVSQLFWVDTEIFAGLLRLYLQQPSHRRQLIHTASRLRLASLEGHKDYQPFHSIGTLYPSVSILEESAVDLDEPEDLTGAHFLYSLPTLLSEDEISSPPLLHMDEKVPPLILSGYQHLYHSEQMDCYFLLVRDCCHPTSFKQMHTGWIHGRISKIFSSIICGWGENRTVTEPHSTTFCVTAPAYLLIELG
ncbi:hypothetical protein NW801_02385 [Brevibacillus laterosporus]|uniref:Uncharacterized protein n=1 Tax=Brevibacillus halotolerans TaxID=1507437 RepID=A0ABT4HS88_9BACL|nr:MULTISPECIES: hypothetical protein [Brevibacillus]MCR8983927.1 hypothetical protein [Brevibacillus laterosporus]MCZ0829646.1 hypothetical protein [Brevibacillus halotolerans]